MIERLLRERVGYGLRSKNVSVYEQAMCEYFTCICLARFQYGKKGWTAYHFAAMCLDIDTLKMLKSSGFPFNPNERTEVNVTSSCIIGTFSGTVFGASTYLTLRFPSL